jgi:hypothetical protein
MVKHMHVALPDQRVVAAVPGPTKEKRQPRKAGQGTGGVRVSEVEEQAGGVPPRGSAQHVKGFLVRGTALPPRRPRHHSDPGCCLDSRRPSRVSLQTDFWVDFGVGGRDGEP